MKRKRRNDEGPARRIQFHGRRRSCAGIAPTRKGVGKVPFESLLELDLVDLMTDDGDVVSLRAQPETFRWTDGLTGERRSYTPDFLVARSDGTSVYREVKPSKVLRADPEFGGRRARIELECRARGADFEVWTEREIRRVGGTAPFVRHATIEEAAVLSGAAFGGDGPRWGSGADGSPLLDLVARELRIPNLRPCGLGWVGRSALTGIAMAVMCDLDVDPVTKLLVWKPGRMPEHHRGGFRQSARRIRGNPA
ncbi:TnsA endonuclease N-terminal domain-containing protein [Aureimonas sp. AU22]|uniref:TnsA endonuclease N-terminal domain-containing protein n=1 Tax=Aureimonas sp. AU22 TaxID=1638162 RepID=UPI000783EA6C|nr:TnsA endonuclease N-terminal domain-containing protein [Aureimonas sp. AU22]